MSKQMTSLAVLELGSVSAGYRALSIVTHSLAVKVLEASAVGGGRFLVVFSGVEDELRDLLQEARTAVDHPHSGGFVDSDLLLDVHPDLLNSIYSLADTPLQDSLVVIDCHSVSGLLASVHTLLSDHRLKVIEVKVNRGGVGGGYGFLTGPEKICAPAAEDIRTRLNRVLRKGSIEVIDKPGAKLRSFFEFSS